MLTETINSLDYFLALLPKIELTGGWQFILRCSHTDFWADSTPNPAPLCCSMFRAFPQVLSLARGSPASLGSDSGILLFLKSFLTWPWEGLFLWQPNLSFHETEWFFTPNSWWLSQDMGSLTWQGSLHLPCSVRKFRQGWAACSPASLSWKWMCNLLYLVGWVIWDFKGYPKLSNTHMLLVLGECFVSGISPGPSDGGC